MTLGDNIRNLRKKNNMTQSELGEKLKVTKANVSKYENNRIEPNIKTLRNLSCVLDASIDYLVNEDKLPNAESSSNDDVKNQALHEGLEDMLIRQGIIDPEEDMTEEQTKWLLQLMEKAIEMTKLNDQPPK